MGNLLSIHKDILRKIFREHLEKNDRFMLLWSIGVKMNLTPRLINSASKKGHLNILKWLKAINCYYDIENPSCSMHAAAYGHIEVLTWFKENGYKWDAGVCKYAAKNGQFETLKWLKENNCPWNSSVCDMAAANGHLDILKWLKENNCPWSIWLSNFAFYGNHFKILEWIKEGSKA